MLKVSTTTDRTLRTEQPPSSLWEDTKPILQMWIWEEYCRTFPAGMSELQGAKENIKKERGNWKDETGQTIRSANIIKHTMEYVRTTGRLE